MHLHARVCINCDASLVDVTGSYGQEASVFATNETSGVNDTVKS